MTDHRKSDRVLVYQDKTGDWRWRRRAANGETVAEGGEGYQSRHHALTMARDLNPDVEIHEEGDDPF